MKWFTLLCLCLILALGGCLSGQSDILTPVITSTQTNIPSSPVPRITMLPTWTLAPTITPRFTLTPRHTSTPIVTPASPRSPGVPAYLGPPEKVSTELLVDRPTFSQLATPLNLVTLLYDPSTWTVNTAYPSTYMGYSLVHRSNYGCKLEPSIGASVEGYQVEHYSRPLGSTTFEIARFSQAGVLSFANYCTGKDEDSTCYQVAPGDDHAICVEAAEAVLATFKLIANPFIDTFATSTDRWLCGDHAETSGLCRISYSVPLNTLAFASDNQAWAAGDDGLLFHRIGINWTEATSPSTHPIYDLSFSNPSDGWAVGDGAQVLRWDGNAWSEILPYHGPGEGPGGSTQILYAVDAYTSRDVWMVGAMKGVDGKTVPYALHWDGKDLIEQDAFPECNCGLNAVLVIDKNDVYAAGGSDLGAIVFHWDGSTWTENLLPGSDHLYTLDLAADGTLWTAGIEVARDRSDTRGTLFRWDGVNWLRISLPPLTGGVYSMAVTPKSEVILGGDFTALRTNLTWEPISTVITGYGRIVDIETDPQGTVWALTRSGNLFHLQMHP